MPCSCIKGDFNFYLSSLTNEALIYEDASKWQEGSGYEFPEVYPLEIETPQGSKYTVSVNASGKNRIDSSLLGLSAGLQFLDGIYCFSTTSCGKTYSRSRAYTPGLECCIQDLTSKAKTKEDFQTLHKLSLFIKAIHVNSELGKEQLAKDFFKMAKKELELLSCKCQI